MKAIQEKKYLTIVEHYEKCLAQHGDSFLGVDWPKQQDVDMRYRVMLELIQVSAASKVTLLDFGCGLSHLYEYIQKHEMANIEYSGLDISPRFIERCRQIFPNNAYHCVDILETPEKLSKYDYIVMNGVFTEKQELSFQEMFAYFKTLITNIFLKAHIGIAFNVMSKQVDWERDDLFHLPFDELAMFLTTSVSRHFVIRNDYGLYEYTVYVYKHITLKN